MVPEVAHRGVLRVSTKGVLLRIGGPEDIVSQHVYYYHHPHLPERERGVMIDQITRLQGEDKGHPGEIPLV